MKSLLATLPLALLGMACGQAFGAYPPTFECCSPTIDLPDVAEIEFGPAPMSATIAVPTSDASDTPGLTALLRVAESGTIQSQAMFFTPIPGEIVPVETFSSVRFTRFATIGTGTDVSFSFTKFSVTHKRIPIPAPATAWLLLIGLGGLWWFAPKRAA